MINEIKSKDNEIIKYVKKLQNNAFSKEEKRFLLEGNHLVEMGREHIDFILCLPSFKDKSLYNKVYIINEMLMNKLTQNKSITEVIGVSKYINENEINSLRVLYLDDVQDPGNVGTILRTALAFGFKDVILSKGCAFKYSFKVIQSSQGSIFKLNVVSNDKDFLFSLKNRGYKLISTSLDKDSKFLSEINFNKDSKYVVILGNEGQGISKDIQEKSDIKIKIEINDIDSLNVGVAGGIIMYETRFTKWFEAIEKENN